MLKFNPLIDLFFAGQSWQTRAERIARCGYSHIETWQGGNPAELAEMVKGGVQLVSIVMNFADDAAVAPINVDNRARFLERIDRFADHALSAGCRQGIVTAGQQIVGRGHAGCRAALVDALAAAGALVRKRGFALNLEPLNTEVDHPGYFLSDPAEAVAIVKETGCANVKILYDIYHMTIMTGNQTEFLRHNLGHIGHFHVAGVPGRHEPDGGETNYPFLFREIEQAGYTGFVGLEYFPLRPSQESLEATRQYFTRDL